MQLQNKLGIFGILSAILFYYWANNLVSTHHFIVTILSNLNCLLQYNNANSTPIDNANEQTYITNVANLSDSRKLEEFFAAQSAIYIENVYPLYVKRFDEMLKELNAGSKRRRSVKNIVEQLTYVLMEQDYLEKVKKFEKFCYKVFGQRTYIEQCRKANM